MNHDMITVNIVHIKGFEVRGKIFSVLVNEKIQFEYAYNSNQDAVDAYRIFVKRLNDGRNKSVFVEIPTQHEVDKTHPVS